MRWELKTLGRSAGKGKRELGTGYVQIGGYTEAFSGIELEVEGE